MTLLIILPYQDLDYGQIHFWRFGPTATYINDDGHNPIRRSVLELIHVYELLHPRIISPSLTSHLRVLGPGSSPQIAVRPFKSTEDVVVGAWPNEASEESVPCFDRGEGVAKAAWLIVVGDIVAITVSVFREDIVVAEPIAGGCRFFGLFLGGRSLLNGSSLLSPARWRELGDWWVFAECLSHKVTLSKVQLATRSKVDTVLFVEPPAWAIIPVSVLGLRRTVLFGALLSATIHISESGLTCNTLGSLTDGGWVGVGHVDGLVRVLVGSGGIVDGLVGGWVGFGLVLDSLVEVWVGVGHGGGLVGVTLLVGSSFQVKTSEVQVDGARTNTRERFT
ncbi:uncharacterized protein N7473_011293 [Penicillium subrubescens]|uniref:uncharacterized protein n=1 Tax=Penicillium subrubescens TaxID=1316194 RepID=UPI002545B7C9|nr:uncharacterized protein N7473_011293 [Penicillium subrubescens]KAJ5880240.1 hypothetical protein N7473_011293 [Penicillium subrubescens]